jgi:hypothetical protein
LCRRPRKQQIFDAAPEPKSAFFPEGGHLNLDVGALDAAVSFILRRFG